MKIVKGLTIVLLFLLFTSCENCERPILNAYIYSIDINNLNIEKHGLLFGDCEYDGQYDSDNYYYSPNHNFFLQMGDGYYNLEYCDFETGKVLHYINTEQDTRHISIHYSNSGDKIIYAENTIFIDSVEGNDLHELCNGSYPYFNSSDNKIVFVDAQGYLSVFDLTFNEESHLIYDDSIKYPIFHPNGDKIYYSSSNGIHVLFLADTISVNISNGDPNNCSSIFSISDSGDNKVFSSNENIYLIDSQDNLINLETVGIYPHLSHDGSKVIYSILNGYNRHSIYIMNIDGTEKIKLCNTTNDADNSCFSFDDEKVFYIDQVMEMTDYYCEE